MTILLEWKMPEQAAKQEWDRAMPGVKTALSMRIALWLLISSVGLLIFRSLSPEEFAKGLPMIVIIVAGYPFVLLLTLYMLRATPGRYAMTDAGLMFRGLGRRPTIYRWEEVSGFQFNDYRPDPSLRALEFVIAGGARGKRWVFDPTQVSEEEIKRIMSERAGQPARSGTASDS